MILFYCALRARQLPIKFDESDRHNVIQQIDHNFPLSLTLLIIEMMSTMFKTKVKPRGATEWFHCRVVFRVFFPSCATCVSNSLSEREDIDFRGFVNQIGNVKKMISQAFSFRNITRKCETLRKLCKYSGKYL